LGLKLFLLALLHLICAISTVAQDLKKIKLNKADVLNDVKYKYEYNSTDSYYHIQLLLFRNGIYKYVLDHFAQTLFSEGKWEIKSRTLLLNSNISKHAVPASISYCSDTGRIVNGFKFAIVTNRKGQLMTDAFVIINVDTVKCLPLAGACVGTYNTIDSVRLLFENGLSSKWMKVKNAPDKNICITAEVDHPLSQYTAFDEFRCRMINDSLKSETGRWNQ
jgi:hypothetical protein